jgi:hypothetical protein
VQAVLRVSVRLGYDDREAASHAFAEVADGIHSTYEIAYVALSHGTPSPAALERADREEARATRLTTDPDESLQSVRAALRQRRAQASSQRSGPVEDALADLADVTGDSMTAVDVGGHMTCTEADAIARALLAGGHRYAASRWLDGHARGDEDIADDRHVGDSFDLDAYLDGLDPRRVVIGGRERSERGTLACVAHDREEWAPVIRELAGAAVIEDPAWPGLASPRRSTARTRQAGMCAKGYRGLSRNMRCRTGTRLASCTTGCCATVRRQCPHRPRGLVRAAR